MSKIFVDLIAEQINFLDERFYQLGEEYVPSVTTILEAYPKGYGYMQWLKDLGNNAQSVVDRAAQVGTNVHDAVHRALRGEILQWADENGHENYSLEEWQYILKFLSFWQTYKPRLIATEVSLINTKLGYAGTLDLIIEFNSQIWLVDLKTSNAIYPSYELQVAAYRALWRDSETFILMDGVLDSITEMFGAERVIDRSGIFWFKAATRGADKAGKKIQGEGWILKEFTKPFEESFDLFQATHKIWKNENPNPKPKNKVYPISVDLLNNGQEKI